MMLLASQSNICHMNVFELTWQLSYTLQTQRAEIDNPTAWLLRAVEASLDKSLEWQ